MSEFMVWGLEVLREGSCDCLIPHKWGGSPVCLA